MATSAGACAAKQRAWHVANACVVQGDAAAMPFAAGSFDLAVSNLGLNNFADARTAVSECARVLRPGGVIALTTNLQGHMREFYAMFESVLQRARLDDAVEALRAHVEHRATVDGVRTLFEEADIRVTRVIERGRPMRFASGSALLRHHFIRLGFLGAWKAVVPEQDHVRVFETVEANLNQLAIERGELMLTIPLAYVEGTRT
ncbi:MAG: methyltransferase domain-containing protein [Chloroflexi bacterium]|nr:methyltransferase domain-containing protein [Chloroflexota bacterium]